MVGLRSALVFKKGDSPGLKGVEGLLALHGQAFLSEEPEGLKQK